MLVIGAFIGYPENRGFAAVRAVTQIRCPGIAMRQARGMVQIHGRRAASTRRERMNWTISVKKVNNSMAWLYHPPLWLSSAFSVAGWILSQRGQRSMSGIIAALYVVGTDFDSIAGSSVIRFPINN
jgi:hypothetical protein